MIRVAIFTEKLPNDPKLEDILNKISFCIKYNIPYVRDINNLKIKEMKVMKVLAYYENEWREFERMKRRF